MNTNDHDDDFELRLRRKERFVPQFDADLDGPDESVDRAVLLRARATVLQPPAAEPRFLRTLPWTLPLALAATVLLSFTLIIQMDSRDVIAERTAEQTASTARDATADLPGGAAAQPVAASAAAASAPAPEAVIADKTLAATASAEVAIALPAAQAPTAPVPVAAAPTAAPPPSPAMAGSALRAAPSADRAESMDTAQASDPQRSESPEAWLVRIEQLRTAGDLAAAQRELVAFRTRYPDTELPPTLRALLGP